MSANDELAHWQARFASQDYRFGTEPNAFLKSQSHLLRAGQSALAVADGEGRNGVWLAEQGLTVLSADFSPNAQNKAGALAQQRGVSLQLQQVDLAQWPWPADAFDVIAAIFIQFAPPPQRESIFAGMVRSLKPGGLLLMQGYTPKQLEYKTGGPPLVENLYTRAMLETAFAQFAQLDIREHESVIHEGAGHAGMSALIDLVGRK